MFNYESAARALLSCEKSRHAIFPKFTIGSFDAVSVLAAHMEHGSPLFRDGLEGRASFAGARRLTIQLHLDVDGQAALIAYYPSVGEALASMRAKAAALKVPLSSISLRVEVDKVESDPPATCGGMGCGDGTGCGNAAGEGGLCGYSLEIDEEEVPCNCCDECRNECEANI